MNFEEAFMQALYELIERDACAIWWYNRVKLPAYDLDTSESQFIRTATSRYADLGRNLIVLDLRNDLDIPIACAISWTDSGSEIGVGLGCDLDMEIAVSRAICELNQFVAGISIGPEVSSQSIQSEIVEWITNTKIREVDFMVPLDDGKVAIQRREECKNSSLNQDLERVINRLAERGLDTYYLDMSRPEAGLRCVRAIVPGLRHFWARFAPGRLYDVPVKLGWLTKPTPEQGLNPIPFFL
jgi:ribosomal protein S12 methylthiotransferase accessory factor